MTAAVKDGDRVRVVMEGTATRLRGETFEIDSGNDCNIIVPDAEHIVSVEKVAAVGDVIATVDGLDGLPPGSVILDNEGDAWQKPREVDDSEDRDTWQSAAVSDEDNYHRASVVLDAYGPVVVLHIGVKS